jgi:hypothetical protein
MGVLVSLVRFLLCLHPLEVESVFATAPVAGVAAVWVEFILVDNKLNVWVGGVRCWRCSRRTGSMSSRSQVLLRSQPVARGSWCCRSVGSGQ